MTHEEHAARQSRLEATLRERRIDALLVTSLVNIRYLTGFTGSNGMLLAGGGEPILVTDPRYEIQAAEQTRCRVRIARGPLLGALKAALGRRPIRRLGFESARIQHATYLMLEEAVPEGRQLIPTSGVIEELRAVKSAAEIERIRASVRLCAKAFHAALRRARPGVREFELAAEIDYRMRKLGAERPAFETIVASGSRSALPHAQPGDKPLERNELLLIDMGAQYRGYTSDMTRMAVIGRPTDKKIREIHKAVLEAQLAAIDCIRPGQTAGAVDRQARRSLKGDGLDRFFTHSTGHGLGLEIHEQPRLGRGDRAKLEAGMVITVEPGVYIEGFGGVRIEDTVLVTPSGCEVLTPASKELAVL